jgi:hypothetical protein
VWTGPATEIVQARHTSAVLFELIARARKRLTLASFASYPIAGLIERLQSALDRGVKVELLLESSYDSDQRLSLGAEVAFLPLAQRAVTYVWPRELRPPGALTHAKFLIVDESVALITSANLTEKGIDRNLELGVLIRNGLVPKALASHVDQLTAGGTLRLVPEIRLSIGLHGDPNGPSQHECASNPLYHVLGAVAEFEREVIKEHTLAGLKAAKKRGTHLGRPTDVLAGSRREHALKLLAEGHSQIQVARIMRVSRTTIQRAVAA